MASNNHYGLNTKGRDDYSGAFEINTSKPIISLPINEKLAAAKFLTMIVRNV